MPTTASSSTTTTTTPATTTTAPAAAAWTTYGGGPGRDSADTAEGAFGHQPAPAWTSPALDGPVYGQPLVSGGSVYAATQNDTVYALNATDGTVAWSVHLGAPVPAGALPCGDIAPSVGITSTMVLDPAVSLLFASAALWDGSSVRHVLAAVDVRSHTVAWQRDLDQPGWDAAAQLQRAGLALDQGHVLVGFGGNYGDCGPYNGWLIGVPESGSGGQLAYRVPSTRQGAIWAPPGPSVDPTGDVFVATGNGSAGPGQPFDHGNSVIELSPSLQELQYFAPANWAQDSAADADLGSTSPVLLGDGRLFQVGKERTGYLLHAGALGGVRASAPSIALCNSRGATAYGAGNLYVVCSDDGTIVAVQVGTADTLARRWTWHSPTGDVSSPTLARGLLWAVDSQGAVLYGVDPASGATRFSSPLATGTLPHFAAPSAGAGLIVVAGSRAVEAFR
ncbi:MAG: outer membrane protein assembly factor BamB family protein [Acidimicrobiales bacterium]